MHRDGIEALQTIPSFSGYIKYPHIRGGYPLLSSSPEYPHLYSSPLEGEDKRRGALEGEEKRWGVRKGRLRFLAKNRFSGRIMED